MQKIYLIKNIKTKKPKTIRTISLKNINKAQKYLIKILKYN